MEVGEGQSSTQTFFNFVAMKQSTPFKSVSFKCSGNGVCVMGLGERFVAVILPKGIDTYNTYGRMIYINNDIIYIATFKKFLVYYIVSY